MLIRTVSFVVLGLFIVSCGDGSDYGNRSNVERSRKGTKFSKTLEQPESFHEGLHLKVTNKLEHKRPDISVAVCSVPKDVERKEGEKAQKTDPIFCHYSESLIKFDQSEKFWLSKDDIEKIMAKGKPGVVAVKYNDTASGSYMHWYCYDHRETQISDTSNLVTLDLSVTQINTLTYSCRLEK